MLGSRVLRKRTLGYSLSYTPSNISDMRYSLNYSRGKCPRNDSSRDLSPWLGVEGTDAPNSQHLPSFTATWKLIQTGVNRNLISLVELLGTRSQKASIARKSFKVE